MATEFMGHSLPWSYPLQVKLHKFSDTPVFIGNPYLASDGIGNVVYVGEVDTDGDLTNGAERIIALISGDGGIHFDTAQWVNDDPHNGCNNGHQRMPHVTFDTTVSPPQVWVVWGNNNSGNYGGCIRHGRILHSFGAVDGGCQQLNVASINWIVNPDGNSSESVSNMKQSCTGVCSVGQGALMVQAGDGAVTVMYSANDAAPQLPGGTQMGCRGGSSFTTNQGWGTVTSSDNGHSWSTDPYIFNEPANNFYAWCQGGSQLMTFMGLRDFGFARAGNGHLYAAVHSLNDVIRLFESDDKGHNWREFCPANIGNTFDGGPGGAIALDSGAEVQHTPWLQASYVCPNIVFADGGIAANGTGVNTEVMWPTLAADGDNWPVTTNDAGLVTFNSASVANQKSRLLLTYAQAKNETGQFPPYIEVFQANTDPASAGIDNDKFQAQHQLGFNGQVAGPPPAPLGMPGPNLMGSYNNIAVQYGTVACAEDAGFDATPPFSFSPSIQCKASIFWPYWVEYPDGGAMNPTNNPTAITESIVITNPP